MEPKTIRGLAWAQLLVGCLLTAVALLLLANGGRWPWLQALLAGGMFLLSWMAEAFRHQRSRAAEPLRLASFLSALAFVAVSLKVI